MAISFDRPADQEDPSARTPGTPTAAPGLQAFVMLLFFLFGGVTSLNDVLVPKLKDLFTLGYMQAMLVQSAFFAAYFVVSIPAAMLVGRIGYMRGAVAGLLAMMAGCLLFVPASANATFGLFLIALFVLAGGVTIVQVVANPLISLLGPPDTASSRLTFAQAFNSLGTTIFPYAGSLMILGGLATVDTGRLTDTALAAYRSAETRVVMQSYLGLALVLAVIALVVWLRRNSLRGERRRQVRLTDGFDLLRQRRFAFGTACIFLYVGAEVTIGSLIVSHLRQPHVLGIDARSAGTFVSLYWAGALVGRFVGSAVLRLVSPGKVLACNAAAAIGLILLAAGTTGGLAGYSLLAIGLANSVMFPTIFSLASERLGPRAAEGSGVICMAIVGGAIIPPLTGTLADATGSLSAAMALPAVCYALIAAFGLWAARQPGRAEPTS